MTELLKIVDKSFFGAEQKQSFYSNCLSAPLNNLIVLRHMTPSCTYLVGGYFLASSSKNWSVGTLKFCIYTVEADAVVKIIKLCYYVHGNEGKIFCKLTNQIYILYNDFV
jgi:hypothetical protein